MGPSIVACILPPLPPSPQHTHTSLSPSPPPSLSLLSSPSPLPLLSLPPSLSLLPSLPPSLPPSLSLLSYYLVNNIFLGTSPHDLRQQLVHWLCIFIHIWFIQQVLPPDSLIVGWHAQEQQQAVDVCNEKLLISNLIKPVWRKFGGLWKAKAPKPSPQGMMGNESSPLKYHLTVSVNYSLAWFQYKKIQLK